MNVMTIVLKSYLGRVWPRRTTVFCERLSEILRPNEQELLAAINNLPPTALRPFLERALTEDRLTPQHLEACMKRPDLTGLLIEFTLRGRTARLYEELEARLPNWTGLVEGMALRNEISEEMLRRLLSHGDERLRFETAY